MSDNSIIKRISEIQNVGTFSNCKDSGKFQFSKLTLIYGLNTYGKSTLCDIFQSLSENNPDIITSLFTTYYAKL